MRGTAIHALPDRRTVAWCDDPDCGCEFFRVYGESDQKMTDADHAAYAVAA